MDEVHEALVAVAAGKPAPPPRNPTLLLPTATARRRPPRRAVVAGVSAVCLLAVGVLIGSLLNGGRGRGDAVAVSAPTPTSEAPVSTTPPRTSACLASYEVTNSWPGGYQVLVTVRNDDRPSFTGWTVRWELPAGHSINNLWNGSLSQHGSSVTVSNTSYNSVLSAHDTTSFGLIATSRGGDPTRPSVTCESP
jgi:hypothetical protein